MATRRTGPAGRSTAPKRVTAGRRASAGRASESTTKAPRIGDAAIAARTGRAWAEWVAALDGAGARDLPHRDVARLLRERFGLGAWWNQMVAVGYEQLVGRRVVLETAGGFSATASLTVAADARRLFAAAAAGGAWLPRGVVLHRSTPPKSLRATAPGGRKSISVNLYARGPARTQIAVEQGGLATQAEALRVKRQWAASLRTLAAACQSPRAETPAASRGPGRRPTRRK